jgi:hypothetical protein
MLWRIKRFIRKIRNIFLWLPILWRDEQWDGTYVFRILDFKFKLMEENFINDAYVADAKKCAREIHICRLLCKRLIDCEYEEMSFRIWWKKMDDVRRLHDSAGFRFIV